MLELIDGRDSEGPVFVSRPSVPGGAADVGATVSSILEAVRARGDAAVKEWTQKLDGAGGGHIRVPPEALKDAMTRVPPASLDALRALAARLSEISARQIPAGSSPTRQRAGWLFRPLRRVGVYVPGGKVPLPSSVLMGAVPARTAGVEGVAVASPPREDGLIPDPVLAACEVAGVDEVYAMGGAQAIAALAYGTETVRPVDKIVGPGNVYVTEAKRMVRGWVGTDTDAGPTELAIVADGTADPTMLAADLIAQAEHGPHGSHLLIAADERLIGAVNEALEAELAIHPRAEDVENALIEGGRAILVRDMEQALATANAFAPEHLQISLEDPEPALEMVRHAGSVFLGRWSPVAVGDYAGSTNHVLPTGGAARWGSALGASDFLKRVYVTAYDRAGLEEVSGQVRALAEMEGLSGHARSVTLRLDQA